MSADDAGDPSEDRLDGTDPATVRAAIESGDPLPGTAGFAGRVDDLLVRDALGRRPLFVDEAAGGRDEGSRGGDEGDRVGRGDSGDGAGDEWSFDPTDLESPRSLPAGTVRDLAASAASGGDRERPIWSLPDPEPAARADAQAAVTEAVRASVGGVETRDDPGNARVAVAFSGGVDSAVVAAGIPDAPLYVVGFEGAHDVAAARDAADEMGRRGDLRVVELSHADLRRAVPELVATTGRRNPMDLSIALPLYLVAERVAADGYDRLAVGQGADELFGGYAKVVDPSADDRVDADTVRGARRETVLTLPDQLERDVLALRAAGVEPVAPLLHDRVVAAALSLPGDLLVAGDERKVALRTAADGLVPDEVRSTDKKAVQYGTYVSRELDRLARRAGFKRRMDDHVGRYVASLCDEEYESTA
ncbi:asparagine synthase-related protein [Halobaculum sp. CBA1158]|uniref:asparagine synthase C-terminal domain-containing protein n=1 Tax=Halobaculum sp. CBA1158 TaxID=2904243 RepID=UPI001F1F05A4|nr:asparagine synthase-related protein [Halobaculum sp. CBA1158]UIO98492.1 asparagine synthase-related protein [Halobaculum sp. CBA1158]